jgi:hypothetical protein
VNVDESSDPNRTVEIWESDSPTDFYIPAIGPCLFIRPVYRELWAIVKQYLFSRSPSGALITGTPGIGKTAMLIYIFETLREEQSRNKNFNIVLDLYDSSSDVIVARADGSAFSTSRTSTFLETFLNNPNNYYLYDAKKGKDLFSEVKARTVVTSSPNIDHYKEFRKNPYVRTYILPTWSYEEMVDCRNSLTKYQQVDLNTLRDMYEKWGGIVRYTLCFAISEESIKKSEKLLNQAIQTTNWQKAVSSIGMEIIDTKDQGVIAHKIIHIQSGDDYQSPMLCFGSRYILNRVLDRLVQYREETSKQFLLTTPGSYFVTVYGQVFEAYAHRVIPQGGPFPYRSLEDNERNNGSGVLTIPRMKSIVFNKVSEISDGVYGIPRISNFGGGDALWKSDDPNLGTIIFQMTRNLHHGIKYNVLNTLKSQLPQGKVSFIFVVPAPGGNMQLFDSYTLQNYLTTKNNMMETQGFVGVKQYVMAVRI